MADNDSAEETTETDADAESVSAPDPGERFVRLAREVRNARPGDTKKTGFRVFGDTVVVRAQRLAKDGLFVAVVGPENVLAAEEVTLGDDDVVDVLTDTYAAAVERYARMQTAPHRAKKDTVGL